MDSPCVLSKVESAWQPVGKKSLWHDRLEFRSGVLWGRHLLTSKARWPDHVLLGN